MNKYLQIGIVAALVVVLGIGVWWGMVRGAATRTSSHTLSSLGNQNMNETKAQQGQLGEYEQLEFQSFEEIPGTCLSVRPGMVFPADAQGRTGTAKNVAELLTADWQFLIVCKDTLNSSLFHVLAMRHPEDGTVSDDSIAESQKSFPREFKRYKTDQLSEYALYEYASHLTEVRQRKNLLKLEPNKVHLLKRWAWGSALAGCSLDAGDYSRTGEVSVSCGGGDNGCFVSEFVRFGIVKPTVRHDGVCSGNCDLAETEAARISCS